MSANGRNVSNFIGSYKEAKGLLDSINDALDIYLRTKIPDYDEQLKELQAHQRHCELSLTDLDKDPLTKARAKNIWTCRLLINTTFSKYTARLNQGDRRAYESLIGEIEHDLYVTSVALNRDSRNYGKNQYIEKIGQKKLFIEGRSCSSIDAIEKCLEFTADERAHLGFPERLETELRH